jgi:hypothetical protein
MSKSLPSTRKYKKIKMVVGLFFILNGFSMFFYPISPPGFEGHAFSLGNLIVVAMWIIVGVLIFMGKGRLKDKNRWK